MMAPSSFSVIESSLKRLARGRSAFFFTIRRLKSVTEASVMPTSLGIVRPLYSRILVLICNAEAGSWHSRRITCHATRPLDLSWTLTAKGPASALITALSDSSSMCCKRDA